ncbi:EamA family transporter [Portibacter marinus]|uniref:EamA family transporter n=1 Tax=Portibacter marinus TaxID=2898660 RepID=UPI001F366BE5|nr:EamA family transporter [Portibacter marinus]
MSILLLCITVNVMIAIIFKLFPRFGINNFQAIVFNYLTCLLVGTFQLGKFPIPQDFMSMPWFPYVCFLGLLFIAGFNFNATATQKIGISYTALVQKLSLIVPASIAILFYNESVTTLKVAGIIGAILAIILIQLPARNKPVTASVFKQYTWLILGVYCIAAIIEVLLFYMNVNGISTGSDISVVSAIFGIAGLTGFIIMIFNISRGKSEFKFKNVLAGICLGIPNFYSIYLLLYLLVEGWEASVLFPINNVGIISVAALLAFLFFQERLNLFKWIGLILSIISILLISM